MVYFYIDVVPLLWIPRWSISMDSKQISQSFVSDIRPFDCFEVDNLYVEDC
jgi:hypothetical protein